MVEAPEMKVNALAGWFGSARMVSERIGRELDGCACVGVPCAGGMCELRYITARTLLVSDLHRHMINLSTVAGDPQLGPQLYRQLRRMAFHPDTLANAQDRCRLRDAAQDNGLFASTADVGLHDKLAWAVDYFVCCWMSQGGRAGTPNEFTGPLSVRWDAGGGDSATRFRNAVLSLPAWRRVLRRCTFQVLDCFEFFETFKDKPGHGLYVDSPWPGPGDGYTHKFSDADHRRLARVLARYTQTRVVIRNGDHPLIRELYSPAHWNWITRESRTQANKSLPEALILNGPSMGVNA
jgi:DNA adenine methylase